MRQPAHRPQQDPCLANAPNTANPSIPMTCQSRWRPQSALQPPFQWPGLLPRYRSHEQALSPLPPIPHSARCQSVPNTPRLRALALFRRRSPQRVVRSSMPASENLHRSRHRRNAAISSSFDYSITSSAAAWSASGTVRPSALAVLRLMTSWNLVGCWTGRSPGLSPLRMRPV
jgi:hypothetical protein